MKIERLPSSLVLIAVLASIFCAEETLMYSLDYFLPSTMPLPARALINAAALTLILAPLIWWLVMRRLKPARMSKAHIAKVGGDAAANADIERKIPVATESFARAAVTLPDQAANEMTGQYARPTATPPQSGEHYYVPAEDNQRRAAEERIRRLTTHDSVTGLADPQIFYHCLEQDIAATQREQKELALVYLSLARFRRVNSALKQRAGDRILVTVGERIRYQARRSDLVARIDGEEFAVIMGNGAGRQNAMDLCGRIIGALSKPYYLDGQKQAVHIDINIGIAVFPADGQDAEGLVKSAYAEIEKAK